MGHQDVPLVWSHPTLPTCKVQRGVGLGLLPRWPTVSGGSQPETAQGENLASASVFSRLLSFGLEVLVIISVLLNTGDAGSVCEHAELCVRIERLGRMWKQKDGYPFEIHQVKWA